MVARKRSRSPKGVLDIRIKHELPDVVRQLRTLKPSVQKRVLMKMVRAGLKPVARSGPQVYRSFGLRRTGALGAALGVRRRPYKISKNVAFGYYGVRKLAPPGGSTGGGSFRPSPGLVKRVGRLRKQGLVGPGGVIPSKYAHFTEHGTDPHDQPKRRIRHPGSVGGGDANPKPVHWMLTIAKRNRNRIRRAMRKEAIKGLQQEIKRIERKLKKSQRRRMLV